MKQLDIPLLLALLGMHLTLPIVWRGSVVFPEIIVFPLLLIAGHIYRAAINRRIAAVIFGLAMVCLVSIVLSPDWAGHMVDHILSSLNLLFSALLAFAFARYLMRKSLGSTLDFNVTSFLLIAIGISALEITVPWVSQLVDAFRYAVFPADRVYAADWRDTYLFGGKRPTFFGNEPSYLGITLATLAVWLSLRARGGRDQLKAIFLLMLGMAVVRSPTALAIALILPVVFLSDSLRARLKRWRATVLLLSPVLALGAVALVIYVFGARIDQVLAGEDNSSDLRLIKPLEALWHSVSQSPLVGVGIGGRDKLTSVMLSSSDWSDHTSYVLGSGRIADYFSTGAFLIFSEMGAAALVILFLVFRGFKAILPCVRASDFLVSFFMVSITMGGWTQPRLWLLLSLLMVAFQLKRSPERFAATRVAAQGHLPVTGREGGWATQQVDVHPQGWPPGVHRGGVGAL